MLSIVSFVECVNPATLFHLGPRPTSGKGDAQLRANRHLPRIRHHAAACVLHHTIAACQYLLRVEQDQVLRGIVQARQTLGLRRAHRAFQPLRQGGLLVVQTCKIAARSAQPLCERLPLPMLVLLAIGISALDALLQLVQLIGLALQLLRGVHQATLQVVNSLHRVLQAVALGTLQVLPGLAIP